MQKCIILSESRELSLAKREERERERGLKRANVRHTEMEAFSWEQITLLLHFFAKKAIFSSERAKNDHPPSRGSTLACH